MMISMLYFIKPKLRLFILVILICTLIVLKFDMGNFHNQSQIFPQFSYDPTNPHDEFLTLTAQSVIHISVINQLTRCEYNS